MSSGPTQALDTPTSGTSATTPSTAASQSSVARGGKKDKKVRSLFVMFEFGE